MISGTPGSRSGCTPAWIPPNARAGPAGASKCSNRLIEESMQEWSRRSEDSSPRG
ncbi:hypothetical protein GCM10018791_63540 [Streptomyces zaomyceticus]|nr:hypothetical protein GCM10018791_63540 [Streptomyces zaomyceticus]